jgi:hypothetical protein
MRSSSSVQVLSTPRTGSSAFGKLLSDSGFTQPPLKSIENQSASEFNSHGYFEDVELNLCLDNLIRFAFSDRNSFIYNSGMRPDRKVMEENLKSRHLSQYDLSEDSVEIPRDYLTDIRKYTGHDWDVWGLTRMQPNTKWHLAYSRAGVETPEKALNKLQSIISYLGNSNLTFIKDPRLIYLLPLFRTNIRGVVIRRNPSEILRSMRNHYGPNLFTKQTFQTGWVSNHFNYRIQPQDFEDFLDTYRTFEQYAVDNFEINFIDYEKMYDISELDRMSHSLGHPLVWKEIYGRS